MQNPFYAAKKSKVDVPYIFNGIDRKALKEAQDEARKGNWDKGNYLLTSAYRGGEINDKFWDQFI